MDTCTLQNAIGHETVYIGLWALHSMHCFRQGTKVYATAFVLVSPDEVCSALCTSAYPCIHNYFMLRLGSKEADNGQVFVSALPHPSHYSLADKACRLTLCSWCCVFVCWLVAATRSEWSDPVLGDFNKAKDYIRDKFLVRCQPGVHAFPL